MPRVPVCHGFAAGFGQGIVSVVSIADGRKQLGELPGRIRRCCCRRYKRVVGGDQRRNPAQLPLLTLLLSRSLHLTVCIKEISVRLTGASSARNKDNNRVD